jgi:hypothetical protein
MRKIGILQNSRKKSLGVYHFDYFSSGVIYICLFYVINARKMITIHVKTTCEFGGGRGGFYYIIPKFSPVEII